MLSVIFLPPINANCVSLVKEGITLAILLAVIFAIALLLVLQHDIGLKSLRCKGLVGAFWDKRNQSVIHLSHHMDIFEKTRGLHRMYLYQ